MLVLVMIINNPAKASLHLRYNHNNSPFLGVDRPEDFHRVERATSLKNFDRGISLNSIGHFYDANLDQTDHSFPRMVDEDFYSENVGYSAFKVFYPSGKFSLSYSFSTISKDSLFYQSPILNAEILGIMKISETSHLGLGFRGLDKNRLNNASYSDLNSFSLPLSLNHNLSSTLNIGVEYEKSFFQSNKELLEEDSIHLGVDGDLTSSLKALMSFGVQHREIERGISDNRITAASAVRYQVNETTQIGSSISKKYATGPEGQNMEKVSTRIEVDYALNELLFVGTNLAVLNYEDLDSGEDSDLANAGLHFKYKNGDLFNLSAGYTISSSDLEQKVNRKMGHLLNFSASLHF